MQVLLNGISLNGTFSIPENYKNFPWNTRGLFWNKIDTLNLSVRGTKLPEAATMYRCKDPGMNSRKLCDFELLSVAFGTLKIC